VVNGVSQLHQASTNANSNRCLISRLSYSSPVTTEADSFANHGGKTESLHASAVNPASMNKYQYSLQKHGKYAD